jgi:hypothetical protein
MEALTFVVKDRTKIGMSPSSACFLDARPGPQGQPQRVESSEVSGFNRMLRLICDTAAIRFICRYCINWPM